MDTLTMIKALSNERRLQVLEWLKNPEKNFPPHVDVEGFEFGVCVGSIQDKLGLSQSTTSQYMSTLDNAGIVISTRIGKWTYYRRDEEAIAEFAEFIKNSL